jgi:VWFA-related protein
MRIAAFFLVASLFANGARGATSPLTADQARVLALVRAYALEYTAKLPDFICTQVTYRETSLLNITNYVVISTSVIASDEIEEQLTFVNQKESYEVTSINRKEVQGVEHTQIPGAVSAGEFGSLLRDIFDPRSHAAFSWDHMSGSRDHGTYVFAFHVPTESGIRVIEKKSGERILASYSGLIFVEAATKEVVRIDSNVNFPVKFTLKAAKRSVEYKRVSIAGKDYSLPFHSEVRMWDATHAYVNKIDYRAYHKYEVTSGMRIGAAASEPPDPNPAPGSVGERTITAKSAPDIVLPVTPEPSIGTVAVVLPPEPTVTRVESPPSPPRNREVEVVAAQPAPSAKLKIEPPTIATATAGEITWRDEDLVPQEPQTILRTQVNLVVVPVVVRDAKGQAVGDLTQEDFQLFDRGKRQQITKFTVEKLRGPDTANEAATTPGQPPQSSTVEIPSNFVAYWFDDVHLNAGDLIRVRDAAAHNLETLQASDRIAIFTSSGQSNLDFTSDRASLLEALMKLRPRPVSDTPGRQCPDISHYMGDLIINRLDANALEVAIVDTMGCMHLTPLERPLVDGLVRSAARTALMTGEHASHVSLGSLKEVIRRLSVVPGNRSIIVLSPGFYFSTDLQLEEQDVMELATSERVVISTLDARGVYVLNPVGDIEKDSGDAKSTITRADYARNEATASSSMLESLAAGTGGTFIQNTNDLAGGLRRLAAADYTYLLEFTPNDLKDDGKFHALKVKLRSSKKLTAQARRGYFAAKQTVAQEALPQLSADRAIYSRDEIHDLPVELRTQILRSGGMNATLQVDASVDLRRLEFRKDAGRNRNDLTVIWVVFDNNGKVVAGTRRVVEMRLRDETVATLAQQPPMNVTSNFGMPPGKYLVRLIVRESAASLMAAQNAAIEIP